VARLGDRVSTTRAAPTRSDRAKRGLGAKHAPRQKGFKPWLKRWWWVFVAVPGAAMILILAMLVYVYSQLELPNTPPPLQTTFLFDRDDRQIAQLHASVDRTIVDLEDMPRVLRNAVIAVEDKAFYDHPGFDPIGIVRAAWTDIVSGEVVQGASTITQQLVKNVYAGHYEDDPETGAKTYVVPPRTVSQKVREVLLAVKVEQSFTKDEILERYLNTVYFGRGAYGVEAAAQTYWQKPASRLDLVESATLAAVIQSPGFYDPVEHEEEARDRRNYVLEQMVDAGFLTRAEADEAKAAEVETNPLEQGFDFSAKLGYFLDFTRRQLIDQYDEATVYGGGLRVTTTLDMDMQKAAQDAVATNLPDPEDPDAALVAIDPRTGGILAMYGGRNFERDKVNLATGQFGGGTGRQSGSAFKVFTLVAALENDYPLDSTWNGPSTITIPDEKCYTDGAPWELSNASDSENGTFTLLSATTHSVNTVYAQIASAVTPEAIVDVAERMGITSPLEPVCSITLGTQSVSVLEMTRAYATLAASGWKHPATPVQEARDANGERMPTRYGGPGEQVLDEDVANIATEALVTVIASGTGTAADIGRPAAGKTGTAQDYKDAWFCGYIPQLAACVWVGYEDQPRPLENIQGYSAVFGGTIPANIWHDFMTVATENMPVREFPEGSDEDLTNTPPTPVPVTPTGASGTGPTGPTAETAPTGPTAETAPTGPTDPTGPTAPTGPTDPTGPTAPTGPTGATGGAGEGGQGGGGGGGNVGADGPTAKAVPVERRRVLGAMTLR
jgi:penicillin-binding protein 1A